MKRAVLLHPNGQVVPVAIPDNQLVDELKLLQEYVGGYLELVRQSAMPNLTAFCDEDGYAKNLPANDLATSFFNTRIVGKVLVLGQTDSSGDTHGLTVDQVNIFLSPEGEAILNAAEGNDEQGLDYMEDRFGGELP